MANFKTGNPGTWFYIDENDDSFGGVCLRVLSPEESNRINKLTTIKKNKFKAGVHYVEETTNDKMSTRMMWDYVITEWNNINVDGQELECNSVNKTLLMNDPDFMSFIVKSLEELQNDIESGRNLGKN